MSYPHDRAHIAYNGNVPGLRSLAGLVCPRCLLSGIFGMQRLQQSQLHVTSIPDIISFPSCAMHAAGWQGRDGFNMTHAPAHLPGRKCCGAVLSWMHHD